MATRLLSSGRACLILTLLCALALPQARSGAAAPAPAPSFSPLFIQNAGQFATGARLRTWGGGPTVWLAEDAIWLTVHDERADPQAAGKRRPHVSSPSPQQGANIKLSFPGANPQPRLEPFHRLETCVSFFKGSDPAQWRADVPVWGGVRYVDLYPGIDLVLAGGEGALLPRLQARRGADLDAVRLRVEGADAVTVRRGALHLSTVAGDVVWPLLRAEGVTSQARVQARGPMSFELVAPFAPEVSRPAGGRSATDNPAHLIYGTFLGGSSGDWGQAIAVDARGAAYVGGVVQSEDFATTIGAFDPDFNGEHDAFVVKLSADGSALEYATFLGGSHGDPAHGIAVDRSGAVYLTGHTDCSGFPYTAGAYDTTCEPADDWGGDGFVVKLDPTGSVLEYATFLGGSIQEGGFGIVVDDSGAAYVMGVTGSSDFAMTMGAFDTTYNGGTDAFVAKLSADGSQLEYATYLGGSGDDWGSDIAVDGSGSAYVTGFSHSSNFPTTLGAFQTTHGGGANYGDAFVAKVRADGSALEYATFLGGSGDDWGVGIAVDDGGAAYVAGFTYSSDLPTTPGALDTNYNGNSLNGDAFVAKLNAAGSGLEYATFLGGSFGDEANGIVVDASGTAYVTGYTSSPDFPATRGAFDTSINAVDLGWDAFAARLSPAGSALEYATFLGGSGSDEGSAIALDGSGVAYVAGTTSSPDLPTTPGAFDESHNGGLGDAFVIKLWMERSRWVYYLPLVLVNH
jgi:hypothetical protein